MRLGLFSRRERALRLRRRAAAAAAARGDWREAARLLDAIIRDDPSRPVEYVQLGHLLKEAGDRQGALAAYRQAGKAMPADLDSRLHQASLLRLLGDADRAADVYAEMIAIDPDHPVARRGAIELGRRDLIEGQGGTDPLRRLGESVRDAARLAEIAIESSALATTSYDAHRKRYPLPPVPSAMADEPAVDIVIDASDASAAMVHVSLGSVLDQSGVRWNAVVINAAHLADHPVAGFARIDPRIAIRTDGQTTPHTGPVLRMTAGTILAPSAAAWLLDSLKRTGAHAAYGDHDSSERDWLDGETRSAPVLFDAHDPIGLETGPLPIAVVFAQDDEPMISLRVRLTRLNAVVHVPRVVASQYVPPQSARMAPGGARDNGAGAATLIPAHAVDRDRDPIGIIVPTRDQPALLDRAIQTMRGQARYPGRLRFVIVDNRSASADTAAMLSRLGKQGCTIVAFDEPFSWSRANRLGSDHTDAPSLVFANDDVEMLSPGWDETVAANLADDRIGAVGARLTYPTGGIQHAGVLFATATRSLGVHEGVGASDGHGPEGRWSRRRSVSAVTGAFVAMRRSVMLQAGGFDEALFVGYGDLDMCLRIRADGRVIVYDPALRLVHHESATRGMNRTGDEIAWDEAELAVLVRRWGAVLRLDPAYNPQWAVGGRPFDGFREPPLSEILRHVDLARGGSSWRVAAISGA